MVNRKRPSTIGSGTHLLAKNARRYTTRGIVMEPSHGSYLRLPEIAPKKNQANPIFALTSSLAPCSAVFPSPDINLKYYCHIIFIL